MKRLRIQCHKRRFDEVGAKMVIAAAKHSKDSKRQEVRYYWCQACKAYHVTSQEKQHRRKK
jgi:hypothetical protein